MYYFTGVHSDTQIYTNFELLEILTSFGVVITSTNHKITQYSHVPQNRKKTSTQIIRMDKRNVLFLCG